MGLLGKRRQKNLDKIMNDYEDLGNENLEYIYEGKDSNTYSTGLEEILDEAVEECEEDHEAYEEEYEDIEEEYEREYGEGENELDTYDLENEYAEVQSREIDNNDIQDFTNSYSFSSRLPALLVIISIVIFTSVYFLYPIMTRGPKVNKEWKNVMINNKPVMQTDIGKYIKKYPELEIGELINMYSLDELKAKYKVTVYDNDVNKYIDKEKFAIGSIREKDIVSTQAIYKAVYDMLVTTKSKSVTLSKDELKSLNTANIIKYKVQAMQCVSKDEATKAIKSGNINYNNSFEFLSTDKEFKLIVDILAKSKKGVIKEPFKVSKFYYVFNLNSTEKVKSNTEESLKKRKAQVEIDAELNKIKSDLQVSTEK